MRGADGDEDEDEAVGASTGGVSDSVGAASDSDEEEGDEVDGGGVTSIGRVSEGSDGDEESSVGKKDESGGSDGDEVTSMEGGGGSAREVTVAASTRVFEEEEGEEDVCALSFALSTALRSMCVESSFSASDIVSSSEPIGAGIGEPNSPINVSMFESTSMASNFAVEAIFAVPRF